MILQTATGHDIPHTQNSELDESEVRKLPLFYKKYGPDLVERTAPTGFYNCHGMTFASRRAWVYGEGNIINFILQDDSYEEVPQSVVLPGDIILYFGEGNEGVIHSGVVVEVSQFLRGIYKIYSKWAQSAEFLHWAHQTPYGYNVKLFRVKR